MKPGLVRIGHQSASAFVLATNGIAAVGSGAAGWNSLSWVNGDFFYKEISPMWLASLRRLVHLKAHSPKTKKLRQLRRRIVPALEHLENRIVPTGPNSFTIGAGDTAGLITAINSANSDTASGITGDTITLTNSTYSFGSANNTTNGANVLPVITAKNLTITGAGSTLDAGGKGRLFDVASTASVTLVDMTLANGLASGATAQGGAVYSSGSLTLKNDIIGRKTIQTLTTSYNSTGLATKSGVTTKVFGGSNRATGGTGGSGQGAGIYVAGGSLNVTSCTIASNKATGGGSGNGQGGGIYANGSTLTLKNDLIGQKVTRFENNKGAITRTVFSGNSNSASGSAGQGGGLYVSGGTVNVTDNTIQDNQANGAAGAAGSAGGNAQGGGIFANTTTLIITGGSVGGNDARASAGGTGTVNHFAGFAGGNAQGGGIYANATKLTVTGGAVNGNTLFLGDGGAGAAGTANHVTGGAGGVSGLGQGGGIFAQGGSVTLTNSASATGNNIGSSRGGNGGAGFNGPTLFGAGGAGGVGGNTGGGGVFASNATVAVNGGATINANTVFGGYGGTGGAGGHGKAGGQGGNAGSALGGGLYAAGGRVNISGNAAINANTLSPGWGGNGGNGGQGGQGGTGGIAEGGGLYVNNAPVTLLSGTPNFTNINSPGINANTASSPHGFGRGGNGGSGTVSAGGNGGTGGLAQGGGVFITASNLAVTFGSNSQGTAIDGNSVAAGDGGSAGKGKTANGVGGNGGLVTGGGVSIMGNSSTVSGNKLTLNNTTITGNTANGGSGGVGVTARSGVISNYGNGGDMHGGGLYVANLGSATVLNSTMQGNLSLAGSGASGGVAGGTAKYGAAGTALGGAFYSNNSTLNVINSTFATNVLAAGYTGSTVLNGPHSNTGGTAQGGGLYSSNGTLSLTNDTVAWNFLVTYTNRGASAGQGGGIYSGTANTLNLENTIDALNWVFTNSKTGENDSATAVSNGDAAYNDIVGTLTQNDDNLIGGLNGVNDANLLPAIGTNPAGSQQLFAVPPTTNTLGGTTSLSGQVPGNYGGLTYTLPLAWNTSTAIDTGDPSAASTIASAEGLSSATDQRGFAREIDGTIDIGATETQVILTGSAAPPIVQLNGTITYTLEVCNCESTAANVTLTDTLDSNTTNQSGSGTGWTVTAPTVSNPNTVTATASLAAHTMATLTITVSVPSSVPNGTTSFTNTASITPTGSTASEKRSATMKTPLGSSVATTTTSLTASANPTVYGQPVVFTATVTASSGTPGGTVTFEDGSMVLGTGSLSNGVATFSTSALSVGSGHSITAIYGGDSNDSGSTSSAVGHTVNQDGSTTVVTSSATPSVFGQNVTFTATVSANLPGSGTPTGSVTFKDGNTVLGTGTLNNNGVATFSTSTLSAPLSVGSHGITVVYSGDTNFTGSTSSVLSQSVSKDSTTTKLTSSVNSPVFGQTVTYTATVSPVSPGAGTPSGTVTFYDGTTTLGTGTLSNGVATFSTSSLSVATHSITAVYSGDGNDVGSKTTSALSQTVSKDSTTTALTSSVSTSVLGQSVTFTATVSVASPGAGTPTGTVAFEEGSTILGTGTLSNGVATFSTSALPVGSNSITAVYSGDTNDVGSTSSAFSQQVDYKFGGFLPPLSNGISFALNRTIPIKFTLSDVNGNAITSLSAVTAVQIQALDSNGNPSGTPFTPASTNNQGLQFTGGHYQYNWQTKGLTAGSYVIEVVLADGTTQTDTIQLVAHGNSAGLTSGTSGGTATAGALMGGEVDLYVDNSDGDLTSDELSRITDAVNSIDTTIAPYGVTIVQVTDPTLANVTLSMNTTSAVGGYAQGVLGCTTDADQVTMIQGWNWYAGSDPTQIGSAQYDFETAVVHELGHVLGLGHSSSSTSVMYASLTTGTANRALVAADLNVPDTDSGPCALHAAPVMSVSGASNVQGMTALGSTSIPNNGSPMSGLDQLFANLALILADARNAFQSELSSLAALWQQADALALQRLDFMHNLMQVSRLPNED